MRKFLPIAVACCLSLTCMTETQSPGATSQLVGLWRLARIEVKRADGTTTADPDFGPNTIGYLSYDQTGHVSVQIMNPDLPKWKDEDHPTASEAISTIEHGFTAYAGTYEVHEAEGYIVHHPELASTPNYVGQIWKRKFVIEGGRLLRLTPPVFKSVSGELIDETLVWERVY
jgi:Lipocalin-like domain